jgi:uncharacterized OsmC-like protein
MRTFGFGIRPGAGDVPGTKHRVEAGPTGIRMRIRMKLKEGLDDERARRMLGTAERYCSTVQALRNGVNVTTDFAIANS